MHLFFLALNINGIFGINLPSFHPFHPLMLLLLVTYFEQYGSFYMEKNLSCETTRYNGFSKRSMSWHIVNACLSGKVPHTSYSSHLFSNLTRPWSALVQTLPCTVLQVENNLSTAHYWMIALRNWFQCEMMCYVLNIQFKCS